MFGKICKCWYLSYYITLSFGYYIFWNCFWTSILQCLNQEVLEILCLHWITTNNKNGTLKSRKGKALPICQSSFCISLISNSISLVILWENIGPDISIVCYYCLWVIQYPTWDYEYLLVLVKLKNFQIDFVPNFWSKYSIFK